MQNFPIACPQCGQQLEHGVNFCPSCSRPMNQSSNTSSNPAAVGFQPPRKIGWLLGAGIFLMPYIFSWFTLRKGYSALSRGIALGWLGLVVLTLAVSPPPSDRTSVAGSNAGPSMMSSADVGSPAPALTPTESPMESARRQVKLDFEWGTGGFGSIMEADFTITNPSDYPIKDLEITCTHFAASGTEIDSNSRTIYELVPAKGKKVVRNFNMGFIHSQAERSNCKIEDFQLAD